MNAPNKEDNILFPTAERVLPPDRQGKVNADFKRIEHEEAGEGMHEKYLALAEVLEPVRYNLEQVIINSINRRS